LHKQKEYFQSGKALSIGNEMAENPKQVKLLLFFRHGNQGDL